MAKKLKTESAALPHPLGADVTTATATAPAPQVDADEEDSKRKVAIHAYTGANGESVELEEQAFGITYTLLRDKENADAGYLPPVIWNWNDASESARRMFAIFGAKTLATNESSQVRNNKKLKDTPEGGPEAQRQAVVDRFARVESGEWMDRTESARGPAIDKDALAGSIVDVKVSERKIAESERDDDYARVRQRLEDDPVYLKKARNFPAVAMAYAKRKGLTVTTVDDL